MIDTTREIVLVASRSKMLLMAVLALLMSVGGLWMALSVEGNGERYFAWTGFALCGLFAILWLAQSFGNSRPSLVMSPHGFQANKVSVEMIPWSAVRNVSEWSHRGTRMIIVEVTEETWRNIGMTRIVRWTRCANRLLGVRGIPIVTTGMPITFDELMKIFRCYAQAYGASAGN